MEHKHTQGQTPEAAPAEEAAAERRRRSAGRSIKPLPSTRERERGAAASRGHVNALPAEEEIVKKRLLEPTSLVSLPKIYNRTYYCSSHCPALGLLDAAFGLLLPISSKT